MRTDALQQAIYDKLTGNAPLMASLSSAWGTDAVFDHVPQVPDPSSGIYFPYISIQDVSATQWDTDTSFGASGLVQIDVWSRTRSMLEVRQIAQAVYALVHYTDLPISDAVHVWTDVESVEAFTDPDNLTRRAMLSVRVVYDDI